MREYIENYLDTTEQILDATESIKDFTRSVYRNKATLAGYLCMGASATLTAADIGYGLDTSLLLQGISFIGGFITSSLTDHGKETFDNYRQMKELISDGDFSRERKIKIMDIYENQFYCGQVGIDMALEDAGIKLRLD